MAAGALLCNAFVLVVFSRVSSDTRNESQNLRRFAAKFGVEAAEPRAEFSWCVEGRKISKEKSAARK